MFAYNRIPHAGEKLTPFELLYNERPDISRIRVWGCPCYSHIVVNKQVKSPAKSKARSGIYLGRHEIDGVQSDGDMVLLETGEVINSAVTKFDETWSVKKSPAESNTSTGNEEALGIVCSTTAGTRAAHSKV